MSDHDDELCDNSLPFEPATIDTLCASCGKRIGSRMLRMGRVALGITPPFFWMRSPPETAFMFPWYSWGFGGAVVGCFFDGGIVTCGRRSCRAARENGSDE